MVEAQEFDPLLQALLQNKVLTDADAQGIWDEHISSDKPIRNIVLDHKIMSEDELLEIVAGYHGSRVINLP
ncbi:MAG: hypothetical protein O3C57_03225, partial [Verrucomicrobia bacterium]|nr:hypothetical protein [Verrucomicrobiota bacterium]